MRYQAHMSNWEQRRLCPDGACLGVIDSRGRCTACGSVAEGGGNAESENEAGAADEKRVAGLGSDDSAAKDDHDDDGDAGDADAGDADIDDAVSDDIDDNARKAGDAPSDWERRVLCPNGACTGVIGHDGRCPQCHQSP